jgi:hypothetical protein
MDSDPHYVDLYYSLWAAALRDRDDDLVQMCLRRMVSEGDMPRPLFDFGHNIIAGAPQGAVIFTNGDNDTYPPLAYQAITGERPDVSIVNLSLLNTRWYLGYLHDNGIPIGSGESAVAQLDPAKAPISPEAQRLILEGLQASGEPRPLFYCITVYEGSRVLPGKTVLEGLLMRIVPGEGGDESESEEIDVARTRDLFDTVYRIDSITDPLVDWARESSVAMLGTNYPAVLRIVASDLIDGGQASAAGPYLYRAVRILSFHGHDGQARAVLEEWEGADPGSRLLAKARSFL